MTEAWPRSRMSLTSTTRADPNPFLSPFIRPLYLDDYEKAALVAFLRTLTDQQFEHLASEDSGSTYSGDRTGGRN